MPSPSIPITDFIKKKNASSVPTSTDTAPKKMSVDEFIAAKKASTTPPSTSTPTSAQPPKSFVDTILGGGQAVSDFFGGKGISDLAGTAIAKATVPAEQKKYVSPGPTDKQVLGSALQLGSLFIPVGRAAEGIAGLAKGAKIIPQATKAGIKLAPLGQKAADLVGKVTAGAGSGAIYDTGSALQGNDTGGAGTIIGGALPLVPSALKGVSKLFPSSGVAKTAEEAAGRVVQGNTKAADIASKALPLVDTKGVKTYDELFKRVSDTVDTKIAGVDAEFAKSTAPIKLSNLTQTLESGTAKGKVNYVRDALTQLGALYKRTKDLPGQLKIKDLLTKARGIGLTPSEINQLARDYGSEFKAKGFSKVGEALTNISDQAYENTRKGIKEVARSFLTSDSARTLDKEASQLLTTQKLVKKMAEKVSALEQRIKSRGTLEGVGRAVGEGIDFATFGGIKGFLSKFFPSNVGLKTMNSMDLEKELAKNLSLINKLSKAPDSVIQKVIKALYDPKKSKLPGDVILRQILGN